MFYHSLMAGQSRGFTLMAGWTEEPAGRSGAERDAEEARQSDLVAALRFPMAPDWILRRTRRPVVPEAPLLRPAPRGCG